MAKNQQLVLAFFDTEAAADNAVNELKNWDKASKEIKLGSIGVLVKDDKGKVKTNKLGARHTGAGLVLGAIAGVLTGGLSIVAGLAIGGVLGTLVHKGLGMSKEDVARIGSELDGGKAAVGVLANDAEAAAVTAKLGELGGKTETHAVTEEAVAEAEQAVAADPAAIEEAPAETTASETAAPAAEETAAPAAADAPAPEAAAPAADAAASEPPTAPTA